jgi:hypothetical protein
LEALLRRKSALAQRLERVLIEAQAEREAIEGELAAVLVSREIWANWRSNWM